MIEIFESKENSELMLVMFKMFNKTLHDVYSERLDRDENNFNKIKKKSEKITTL